MKYLNNLIYILVFLLLSACCSDDDKAGFVKSDFRGQPCYFSKSDIEVLLRNNDGVRFYNAMNPSTKTETLMGVGVLNGADAANANYNMFVRVSSDPNVNRVLIDKNAARTNFDKISLNQRYAVSYSEREMNQFLASGNFQGVVFIPVINSDGNQTLVGLGASFNNNGQLVPTSNIISNPNPCPINCGQSPASHYLSQMNWSAD